MPCRSYLIRNQISELILRQGCARKQHDCEPEANGESNFATLHTESSLDNASWDVEPEQEASESFGGTAIERQFLNPAGNRMLFPGVRRVVNAVSSVCTILVGNGQAFTVMVAIGPDRRIGPLAKK